MFLSWKKNKKKREKGEVFNARILPQIRHSANLYLSSAKLDDFSLDIQDYIIFSNKLRSGFLSTEPAEDLLGYIDKLETDTQRFLLMVIADKGSIFKHLRNEPGSNFQEEIQRRGYCSKTITNYINLCELLEMYPIPVWNDNYWHIHLQSDAYQTFRAWPWDG